MSLRLVVAPLARGAAARMATYAVAHSAQVMAKRALCNRAAMARRANAQRAMLARNSLYMQSRAFGATAAAWKNIHYKLADIGEGIAEAEVLQWFVEVGDEVHEFDKICEVQSDKATVEITSRYHGKIRRLHYGVGDMAKVGQPLVDIETGEDGGDAAPEAPQASAASSAASEATAAATSASAPCDGSGFVEFDKKLATPAVRRIAKENNININQVAGTGKDGRVLKEDILRFLSGEQPAKPAEPARPAPRAEPTPAAAPAAAPRAAPAIIVTGTDQVVPVRGIQRAMVKSMERAKQVPHFTYGDELEISQLVELRKQLKPVADARGINLSFLPFFMKAISLSLSQYPMINAHVNDDCTEVTYRASHNIGVAMDTPIGLLVPNVKNVQARSIFEIAAELNRLQKDGLAGKLAAEDMQGGTISISNIGAVGGTYMRPVIVVPEVAIGALGRFQTLPRFNAAGDVYKATVCNISWSGDHRVLDGATMARFSNQMKQYLENPQSFILDMK